MKHIRTLDELLTLHTNGYSCPECGRLYLDIAGPSLAVPVYAGIDTECTHPQLIRALIQPPAHGKTRLASSMAGIPLEDPDE